MKIRLGLLNGDLAVRFKIHRPRVSKSFSNWVPMLSNVLSSLIVLPERGTIRTNLPASFKKKLKDVVGIIDYSEVFTERPKNLTARGHTWSNYKHNNTAKYLTGITPSRAVMLFSSSWGGRVSDKQISVDSGFFDKISICDCILADRGFNFKEELAYVCATLKVPHFTKGKSQLSGKEVDTSRQISNVRIHLERVIGQLKKFCMLQNIVPLTQIDLLDDIMIIVCAIIILN